jgi:SAM-dependent methyltransferase
MLTAPSITDTGERMIPALSGQHTFWEHVWRYRFACNQVAGHSVIDVACGEGYGTAAIAAAGAASVVGVDVDPEVCARAQRTYGVDVRCGSADKLPVADSSFDLAVSFETIEHLDSPERFVEEVARVLQPGGTFIVSTPNQPIYSGRGTSNQHHVHEMNQSEFSALLGRQFVDIRWFGQCLPIHPLFQRRGWSRLRRGCLQILSPRSQRDPNSAEREEIVPLVLDQSGLAGHCDPFRVRRLSQSKLQRACYLIAVARKP